MSKKVILRDGNAATHYVVRLIEEVKKKVDGLTPEAIEELKYNGEARRRYIEDFRKNQTIDKLGLNTRQLNQLRNDCFPGREPATKEQRETRERQREQYAEKAGEYYLKQLLHLRMARGDARYDVPRCIQSLMDVTDFSPETLARNRMLYEAFRPGATDEEKLAAVLPHLRRLTQIDLSAIDLSDPQSIVDHADECLRLSTTGWEMQQFIPMLRTLGEDALSQPEMKTLVEHTAAMYEMGKTLGIVTNLMCSSLYPEFGYLSDPAVANLNFDNPIGSGQHRSTVADDYLYGPVLEQYDKSAVGYLMMVSQYQNARDEFIDPARTQREKLDHFNHHPETHNEATEFGSLLRREPASPVTEGRAPVLVYEPAHGTPVINDEAARKSITTAVYGEVDNKQGVYVIPAFHPCVREDARRLYIRNGQGLFVRAFPEADRPDFAGLTEQQLNDIYTSDKRYAYFTAGSTEAQYFMNGNLCPQTEARDPNNPERIERPAFRIMFGADGNRRINGWMTGDERKAFEQEAKRRACDVFLVEQKRVAEMTAAVFGNDFTDEGTSAFRSYAQTMVYNMKQKASEVNPDGPQDLSYPAVGGGLTEDDVVALNLLAAADPAVNSHLMPGLPEAVTLSGYSMIATDMFVQRGSTPVSRLIEFGTAGRQALKPVLERFYADGDAAGLVDFVVGGMTVLSSTMNIPLTLSPNNVSCFRPAVLVHDMLERHPELKEAALAEAERQGKSEEFAMQLENIAVQSRLYTVAEDAVKAEHRLLDYDAGLMKDENGRILSPTADERAELNLRMQRRDFLSAASGLYKKQAEKAVSQQIETLTESYVNRFMNDETLSLEDRNLAVGNSGNQSFILQNNQPNAPAVRLALCVAGGQALVDDAIRAAGPGAEAKTVVSILTDEGLIPENGAVDVHFDYEEAIRDYNTLRDMGIDVNELRARAEQDNITVSMCRLRLINEQRFADNGISSEVRDAATEMGLTYERMLTLAEQKHMTVAEYGKRIIDENRFAGAGISYEAGSLIESLGLTVSELLNLARKKGMTPAAYGQYVVEENKFAESGITAEARGAVREAGLSYDAINELAGQQGVSVAEYGQRLLAESREAARPTVVRTGLSGVEELLTDPAKAAELTGRQLCGMMKELNTISNRNQNDLYTTYQAGELMIKLYRQMKTYGDAHPDFAAEKQQLLTRADLEAAKTTVERSVAAAQKMQAETLPEVPEELRREQPAQPSASRKA